jgi:hypothetical protein
MEINGIKLISFDEFHAESMMNLEFRKEWERTEPEYVAKLARIDARIQRENAQKAPQKVH